MRTKWVVAAVAVAVAAAVVAIVVYQHIRYPWGRGAPCSSDRRLPFVSLAHQQFGDIDSPQRVTAIRGPAELTAAGARLQTTGPTVSWRDSIALLVELGSRPSGGYTVRVDRIVPTALGIQVCAIETTATGGVVTAVVTAPWEIVRLRPFAGTARLTVRVHEA